MNFLKAKYKKKLKAIKENLTGANTIFQMVVNLKTCVHDYAN